MGNGSSDCGVGHAMSLPHSFAVTWDYRCPFANNGHAHILDGLEAGADWDVTFVPFFLNQGTGAEGQDTWEDPAHQADLLALAAGVTARDRFPEQFVAVHRSLFAARHADGADLRDRAVVHDALTRAGADADALLAEVDSGWPAKVIRAEHERCVEELDVFGVPTFIVGDDAVFVRLMNRPEGDGAVARATVERVLGLIGDHPELNEFKHTRLSR
jgi:protein-disulfide isomerase-like protein with CxxC motif